MDGGAWWATVCRVAKSQTRLSNSTFFYFSLENFRASLVAQTVKHLSTMRETWVQPLGWEDPLEMGKATHSGILAWGIPWTPVCSSMQMCSVFQSCLTLCDPVDCSPPGSSIHGILQARILEWIAISFSRGSL